MSAGSNPLLERLGLFAGALRRAGLPVDSARVALAHQALLAVEPDAAADLEAALEAVLLNRAGDLALFRELFQAVFVTGLAAPLAEADAGPQREGGDPAGSFDPAGLSPQARQALASSPHRPVPPPASRPRDREAGLAASDLERLRHADFRGLDAEETRRVERLVRGVALAWPRRASRRTRAGARGALPHWGRVVREAARQGGDVPRLIRRQRRREPLPLLVLVDVSGSMERYARLLLGWLHAATRKLKRCDVFAFGTALTDLTPAFRQADPDAMLAVAGRAIADYGGGTRLGDSLAELRRTSAHRLVGGRTLVLLVTDGLDRGDPADLARHLRWLRLHARALLWLNPLMRHEGYAPEARGAAVLHAQADRMLAVHNLARLESWAGRLADWVRD